MGEQSGGLVPEGHVGCGVGPVGVGVGLERILQRPPINLLGVRQKQFGGVPMRPPVHLGDGAGAGAGFGVGVAGFGVGPCVLPLPVSDTQAPPGCAGVRAKCVPAGQGGGRGVFGCVSLPLLV
jgi:hypothetical protein